MSDLNQTVDEHGQDSAPADSVAAVPAYIGRYRVEKVLGRGGFGLVYLAHDDQLQRLVAIKVPHARLVAQTTDAAAYLDEARAVANLDHPNIVSVHDVGSTDQFPCFIVSKYIDGTDLAKRLRQSRLSVHETVTLVATVAEALDYAHKQGLVHRDIKPGNILLDRTGKPFVGDFGLALREQDLGKGPRYAGTPAYMSPEQARGESHRVDGRSDLFSLGVVLYELLTGRRPFQADSRLELLEQIAHGEVRPPREWDPNIPKELERICLKSLSQRASERYPTAGDMVDDLRHFLARSSAEEKSTVTGWERPEGAVARPTPSPVPTPSQPPAVKIVPKGLRAFDAHDADFFLELLPGPRDRDGLPDGIRFWKTRLEATDPNTTLSVVLMYGPSGCGKSSLVRAGLLPRLAAHVVPVYVEATPEETEARLLRGLRKACPALEAGLDLAASLEVLRRGGGLPAERKVVLVLDQFEQWLHARRGEEAPALVRALRHCDGGRVQALVLVRDDFWMAATRFFRDDLELPLREGENSAAVDLFDPRHARKVLAAFGRAYGTLPADGAPNEAGARFLDQAVAGLAGDGRVIPVRLALFAEMVKARPWEPATLAALGGVGGVGVTFLEEAFSAPSAPPAHRLHERAARAVLHALLPAPGTPIKGHLRARAELQEVAGYADRPRDFAELVALLDRELRLITPTDPEGAAAAADPAADTPAGMAPAPGRSYQLTHDYLVPSLREWLTRKQRETRRGRAGLRLAELAAWYQAKPEVRRLPAWWEWLYLRLLTHRRDWTEPQRRMMRRAGRYQATRGAVLAVCLLLLGGIGWEGFGRQEARRLRDRVLDATAEEVPGVIREAAPYRRWLDPLLRQSYTEAEASGNARRQLQASLALLPSEPDRQIDYLLGRLLTGGAEEVVVLRQALRPYGGELSERLWAALTDPKTDPGVRLRAAAALALYAPEDRRWDAVSRDVAARLVAENALVLGRWAEALRPVGKALLQPLAGFVMAEDRSAAERRALALVYAGYAEGQPAGFALLENVLAEVSGPAATPAEKLALARRQANAAVALAAVGRWERVWPLFRHREDPTLRSYLMDRLGPSGAAAGALAARLDREPDVSARRALLLALGDFGPDRLPPSERDRLTPRLVELYRDDPDPGIHGAADWLLRHWGHQGQVGEVDRLLQTAEPVGQRRWYINGQGQTMALAPPGEFETGEGEPRKKVRLVRGFALSAREVTVAEFLRFRKDHRVETRSARTPDCPVNLVSWYDAAAYCNWLSDQEGIPPEQWCYLPNEEGKYAAGMRVKADALRLSGYRLPTAAEWEYACRAGSVTRWSLGDAEDLLARYAWSQANAGGHSHPVGRLRPNDWGLFDLHGNVWEWCQSRCDDQGREEPVGAEGERVDGSCYRQMRGGTYLNRPEDMGSSRLNWNRPEHCTGADGFRVARTVP